MAAPRIDQFSARRVDREPLSVIFEQALAGWRRNHPNDEPKLVFVSAGIIPADLTELQGLAQAQALAVELRRDVGVYEIGVGVRLAPVVEGKGDSDA